MHDRSSYILYKMSELNEIIIIHVVSVLNKCLKTIFVDWSRFVCGWVGDHFSLSISGPGLGKRAFVYRDLSRLIYVEASYPI